MALTKTQINYLESKLNRVAQEKIQEFRKDLETDNSLEYNIAQRIVKGKVKLISTNQIKDIIKDRLQTASGWYSFNISVESLISKEDKEAIDKARCFNSKKIQEFTDRVNKVKQNALDKIVLEGVDIETVLAELDKIK